MADENTKLKSDKRKLREFIEYMLLLHKFDFFKLLPEVYKRGKRVLKETAE